MKRIIITTFCLLLIFWGLNGTIHAEDLSIRDILRYADRARGNVDGVVWNVKVTTLEEESKKYRELIIKARNINVLAKFISPPKMKDRMILMRDRNMWFIRPGLRKPVSISPRQKLIGNASNGDIASTNYVKDYEAILLGEEVVNGENCYVLDLKAANKHVTYDGIKYWVSKNRLVGVKAEFYTISGKLFKIAEFKYENQIKINEKTIIPFVSELIIRDAIQKDKITTLVYSNIRPQKIPTSTFNLNVLLR